jgi:predicted  nucleic acid-binding Zn-ribbon protein
MLKDLYALQKVELAERAVQEERAASRELQQLRQVKAALAERKENLSRIGQEIAALTEQLAGFPRQIKELEDKIAKENKAIYDGSVVNVRELNARETQAAVLSEKLKELQSLQALYLGEQEQKSAQSGEIKKKMTADYQRFIELKATYQELEKNWRQKLEDLLAAKQQLVTSIAPQELQWFESVKCRCGGTPVAMLSEDHVCSGCHTIVPPITFKRTTLGQKTYCEKCGRTLFVADIVAAVAIEGEPPALKSARR